MTTTAHTLDTTLATIQIRKIPCVGGHIYEGETSELLRLAAMSGLDRETCNENGTFYRFYIDGKKVAALVDEGLFVW